MDSIIDRVSQNRPDMPWTENKLDPELVELVKNYEEENKPVLYELFSKYPDKKVITFHTSTPNNKYL